MIENTEKQEKIKKDFYKTEIEKNILKLGELQRRSRELNIPVIIVFDGWDAAGKGTIINNLILSLDPRGFIVYSEGEKEDNEEEYRRPYLYRFWQKLPAKGRISIFDKGWTVKLLKKIVSGKESDEVIRKQFNEINFFEELLSDDGYLIIKFFLQIDRLEQYKRLKKLKQSKLTDWRVTKDDMKQNKEYFKYYAAYDEILKNTGKQLAKWVVINSLYERNATLKVFEEVIRLLSNKIDFVTKNKILSPVETVNLPPVSGNILDNLKLNKKISPDLYRNEIGLYQERFRELEHVLYKKQIPMMIMYEGWDAGGKGGNIKRLTEKLDPRGYEVVPVAAPTETEKLYHYLWRFWNKIPKNGHITIFDRTWYGRVLVERVEKFCSENEWKRAYSEISNTERYLYDNGMIIVKFFLCIDKDEQLLRFKERENTPYKQWKITDEDWRNRDKWDLYKNAIEEAVIRTDTKFAPWTLVEANSKYFARLKTLKTVIDAIENRI